MLGASFIAGRAVMPAIKASRNGRVVALASRSPERAREIISSYEGARILDTYEALLQDAHVDAVYIPLVNSLHKEWTLRALEAGKHVLCEKPLAMNADEAEEMASASQSAGRHVMEAFMYRFHPAMRAFISQLQAPMHVEASFGFTLKDRDNYRMREALGGGALLDVGCYVVSVARWILGEPTDVLARARIANGIDMSVSALLQFDGGRTASLWASFESPEEQELTVITPDRVHRRERPFTSGHDPDDPYQLMVESFADSVIHERPLAVPLSDSIANMRVLDRIREGTTS